MDNSALVATQAIQSILAPAVMISANGLFLLGLNARQTSLFNRIRLLNDEKRKFVREVNHGAELDRCDDIRCLNIDHQINVLLRRAWYVRNALVCCTMAVALFVLSSFAIGMNFLIAQVWLQGTPLYFFISGMILVLSGVIFLTIDEVISYSVIVLEVQKPTT